MLEHLYLGGMQGRQQINTKVNVQATQLVSFLTCVNTDDNTDDAP